MRRGDSFFDFGVLCFLFVVCTALIGCKETSVPKRGEVAPTISGNDVAGEYVNLNQLKGKVVVIYFWSSKCCGDKLKNLEPFYLQHKYDGLSVLAVEVGGSKEKIASFVHENKISFINLTDEYESLARSYRVIGFPTIFLIDKKGVLQKKVSGDLPVDQLSRLVTPLL
jgi:peroxiredoxin